MDFILWVGGGVIGLLILIAAYKVLMGGNTDVKTGDGQSPPRPRPTPLPRPKTKSKHVRFKSTRERDAYVVRLRKSSEWEDDWDDYIILDGAFGVTFQDVVEMALFNLWLDMAPEAAWADEPFPGDWVPEEGPVQSAEPAEEPVGGGNFTDPEPVPAPEPPAETVTQEDFNTIGGPDPEPEPRRPDPPYEPPASPSYDSGDSGGGYDSGDSGDSGGSDD